MKYIRNSLSTLIGLLAIISSSQGQFSDNPAYKKWAFAEYIQVSRNHDGPSDTWYYLIRIKHRDKDGHLIKLRTEFADKPEGETVRAFAQRKRVAVAINASMGRNHLPVDTRQPSGIQIIEGKIVQQLPTTSYTLGIKKDNELVSYPPGIKPSKILKDGAVNALTAFIPLIENHEMVADEVLKIRANLEVKHPRQVIAQFDNLDLLILSCGGRGFEGEGMTARDLMRILKALDVKFAFNLDGGGSTSTVIKDKLITKKIDKKGTAERPRPNFLFIKERNQ